MNYEQSPALREIERQMKTHFQTIRSAVPPLHPLFDALLADERRWRALAAAATSN
jgi:hypothetical protein